MKNVSPVTTAIRTISFIFAVAATGASANSDHSNLNQQAQAALKVSLVETLTTANQSINNQLKVSVTDLVKNQFSADSDIAVTVAKITKNDVDNEKAGE